MKFVQNMLRVFNNYIQKIKRELISAKYCFVENRKNEYFINSEMEGMINALEEG